MAKKVPNKTPTEEARIIGKAEFARLLKKLDMHENEAQAAKGSMGNAVATSVEKHNLHPDALRLFRKYRKKSPLAQAEFLLNAQAYWEYGDFGNADTDLVETAAQRKAKLKKPDADAEAAAEAENKRELAKGTHKIEGGKVVLIKEPEGAEAAA